MVHDVVQNPEVRAALRRGQPGAIVRAVRCARSLTLAQLAGRCHTSGSHLSRLERGRRNLRDVEVLRALATALDIPPIWLGVADSPRAVLPNPCSEATLHGILPPITEDRMRRRTLLTGATGLAGVAVFGTAGAAPISPARALERAVLTGHQHGVTASPTAPLPAAVADLQALYRTGAYRAAVDRLPGVLAITARSPKTTATDRHLAAVWTLASELGVKLGSDLATWTAADRAMQAAHRAGDVLTSATAHRAWTIALRRAGHRRLAQQLVLDTTAALQPELHRGPDHLAAYGALAATAGYTAAVSGDRDTARALLTEATDAAERLTTGEPPDFTGLSVNLYRISTARVLGDYGDAIAAARTIDPATITSSERRARYWADVARALHGWGKPTECYRALLAAEHASPDEVRYRPPIQAVTRDLLSAPTARSMPGLTSFAHRAGVTA